jgi:aspartate/methionine/tyrosine aminotransferase
VNTAVAFEPPAYPYDRLDAAKAVASARFGKVIDLSIGTPGDPPPPLVLRALESNDDADRSARGYPASIGGAALRQAIADWTDRSFGVAIGPDDTAVCVGTKEFVATTPQWLHLRNPSRDTVLYPAVSYPTYEMGALLAGLRAVPVRMTADWSIDVSSIDPADARRALMLWVNTPGNPAGGLDDLSGVAQWGIANGVPVFSDECYAEFTWSGPPSTILGRGGGRSGLEGVVAVHSLSKRSNMAGLRLGWYAGDADILAYLREVRKHAGLMVPGPVQSAGLAALQDQSHVEVQRGRYLERLERAAEVLKALGIAVELPQGGFYLWAPVPGGDEWAWTLEFAERAGALVSPGSFYGAGGSGYMRLAMVSGIEDLDEIARRLGVG